MVDRPQENGSDVRVALRRGFKSAVARWAIAKRRGHALMPPPSPQDEATHLWDGRRHFAEDYTFVGVQAGLGVVIRLEWLPGRDSQRVWVVLLRSDGVWALPGGQAVLRTVGEDRWSAGGLKLDCVTPLRRWTVRFAGRLVRQGHLSTEPTLRIASEDEPTELRGSMDLSFDGEAAPWSPGVDDDPALLARRLGEASWDARLLRAARRARPRGYAQLGRLHGSVSLGDQATTVRAWSLRQHQWGVRDWGACEEAFQCFVATEDERRAWIHHARFPFVTLEGGFIAHEGVEPLRHLECRMETRPHRPPAHVGLALGGAHEFEAELVSDLSFEVDGRGRVDLGLLRVTGPAPGWGLWAGLRRIRPRR